MTGSFQLSPFSAPVSFIFSPFLGCQTPLKDDNLEDERLKPFIFKVEGRWVQDLEATGGPLFFTQVVTTVCVLLLTLGFHPFLVSLNGYYLVIFWAHWMLNVRSINAC